MLGEYINTALESDINLESVRIETGAHGDFYEIRTSTYKPFQEAREKAISGYQRKIETKTLKMTDTQAALAKPIAEHLMIDWQVSISEEQAKKYLPGIKTVKDKNRPGTVLIPFTAENAEAVLKSERFSVFFADVFNNACKNENFIKEEQEDDRKN